MIAKIELGITEENVLAYEDDEITEDHGSLKDETNCKEQAETIIRKKIPKTAICDNELAKSNQSKGDNFLRFDQDNLIMGGIHQKSVTSPKSQNEI